MYAIRSYYVVDRVRAGGDRVAEPFLEGASGIAGLDHVVNRLAPFALQQLGVRLRNKRRQAKVFGMVGDHSYNFV